MKYRHFALRFTLILTSFLFAFSNCSMEKSENHDNDESDHPTEVKSTEAEKKLRHVVLFKFKEGTSNESITEVEEAFKVLPTKIPEIKDFEFGTNNSPEGLDKGFTHCFFLTFDSEEGRAVYLPHPDHKAFGEMLGPCLDDVLVLDYWVKE